MKKNIVTLAALLPLVSFAQEPVTFNVGKAHNCLSMGRGCVHGESNTITFNVEKIEENIITLSISTVGLSEEDQYFLIGDELANIGDESYSTQEEDYRSEEHTSELQSRPHLVCRLLLEKKKKKIQKIYLIRNTIKTEHIT